MKNLALRLLTDKRNLEFIDNIKHILQDKFYDSSYSNLLGFTIQNGYLQFKSYYELKSVPTTEQLLTCLPEAESFQKESLLWDSSLKSSLALGLKIDENTTTQYFHVKYGKNSPSIIHKKPIPFLNLLEEKSVLCGISYEYTGTSTLQKNYLYVINKNDMKKLMLIKSIDENADKLEQIECYYTNDDFKVNLVYEKPTDSRIDSIVRKLDNKTVEQYEGVLSFLNAHNKQVWYIGITKSKKLSIYFTVTRDKDFVKNLL